MKPKNPPPLAYMPVYETPPRSGNEINGWGEKVKRRARHVFHTSPAYGMPDWFVLNRFFTLLSVWGTFWRRSRMVWWNRRMLGPVAKIQRRVDDPAAMAAEMKAKAKEFGADLVGVAPVVESALYEHSNLDYPHAIALGLGMDRNKMSSAPQAEAACEVMWVYGNCTRTAVLLAEWIRAQGWRAKAVADTQSTDLLHIPVAIEAGLGQLGKHGSMISREFGSNFRLATVLTDMPLAHDGPMDIAVDDLCATCRRCTLDCPPGAIMDAKQWVRGEERWYTNFDKCAPYFSITGGCAICIEVCPWSEPDRGFALSEQLLKKRAKRRPVAPAEAAE